MQKTDISTAPANNNGTQVQLTKWLIHKVLKTVPKSYLFTFIQGKANV